MYSTCDLNAAVPQKLCPGPTAVPHKGSSVQRVRTLRGRRGQQTSQ